MLLLLAVMLFQLPTLGQDATASVDGHFVNSPAFETVITSSEYSKNMQIADTTPKAAPEGIEAPRSAEGTETALSDVPERLVPEPAPVVGAVTSLLGSAAPALPVVTVYSSTQIHPISALAGYGSV